MSGVAIPYTDTEKAAIMSAITQSYRCEIWMGNVYLTSLGAFSTNFVRVAYNGTTYIGAAFWRAPYNGFAYALNISSDLTWTTTARVDLVNTTRSTTQQGVNFSAGQSGGLVDYTTTSGPVPFSKNDQLYCTMNFGVTGVSNTVDCRMQVMFTP